MEIFNNYTCEIIYILVFKLLSNFPKKKYKSYFVFKYFYMVYKIKRFIIKFLKSSHINMISFILIFLNSKKKKKFFVYYYIWMHL